MLNEEVVKAALFHDIGKALQRLRNDKVYHGLEGAKFLKGLKNPFFSDSVLASIYDHHHRISPGDDEIKFFEGLNVEEELLGRMTKIVRKADSFDAGQRREEKEDSEKPSDAGWGRVQKSRVISFFSYAKEKQDGFEEREINFDELKVFPLQFFSGSSRGVNEPGYKYSEMDRELGKAGFYSSLDWAVRGKSFDNAINNSLVWMREFSWFMPASTWDKENKSSIFEHSKNVAAFARALLESKERKPALLVLGDFSGIQGFIKNQSLKSEDQKGFTKRSRGRSFLVQVLTELSVQLLLKRMHLNRVSVPISAGGHFYLLVPNTVENLKVLEKTELEINELLVKYTDKLGLVLAWVEAGRDDFKPELLRGIIDELNRNKNEKKFQFLLPGSIYEKIFSKEFEGRACKSCGFKEELQGSGEWETAISEKDGLCELCRLSQVIGEKYKAEKLYLVTSDHPIRGEKEECLFNDFPFRELGHVFLLEEDGGELRVPALLEKGFFYCFVDYRLVAEKYNPKSRFFSKELLGAVKGCDVSFDFGFKPSTGTPELEQIAVVGGKKSTKAKLAHLKLDVDDLGETLKKAGTVSQLSTISNQLLLFFGKKISEVLLRDKDFSDLYTVFIGGDDVYLLGRYDKIFRFSKEIASEFDAFYGEDATLSGGMTLLHHAFPMNSAVELAGVELANAKAYECDGRKKNAVSLFGKSIGWVDWFDILRFSKELGNSDVSTAQLHMLMKLLKKQESRSRKIHQFYYLFGRLKERAKGSEVIGELEKRILGSSMSDWPDRISKKAILLTEVALLMKRIKIVKEGGGK